MKRVLMIAYDFPPIAKSGVQRTVKFAKYLPLYGWGPIVLTVKRREDLLEASDWSLLEECPKDLKIYRTRVLEPYDIYSIFGGKGKQGSDVFYFENTDTLKGKLSNLISRCLVPDTKIGWYPFSIRDSKKIFEENEVDVIFSTSPKMTAHLIARTLAKKYQKPWVADFRDPWTGVVKRLPAFEQWDHFLEAAVINRADKIVAIMDEINNDFIERYPSNSRDKFVTIPHGFDREDFDILKSKSFSKFTIIYTGTFYKGRDPQALLESTSLLLRENRGLRNDIQIIFLGQEYYKTKQIVESFGLTDIVRLIPHVSHREFLKYLMAAHVCFFTVTKRAAITVKLFDYIGAGKPILALIPKNCPAAEIIARTKSGAVIEPEDIGMAMNTILSFYDSYKAKNLKLVRDDHSVIQQYERKNQTQQLAKIFNDLC